MRTLKVIWQLGVRGDLVPFVALACIAPGCPERVSVSTWLWAQVKPGLDAESLGSLGNALELCGLDLTTGPDRLRYFKEAGLPLPVDMAAERFAVILGGTFRMDSPETDADQLRNEGPQHDVTVSPFAMMKTAVTVADYRRFDRSWNGEFDQPNFPVTKVSWWSAWLFARWSGATLPTDAQWEYACRGGTETRVWSGDDEADLAKVGWYSDNSENTLHAVGLRTTPAHPWGLLDLHGLVREWCLDGPRPYGEAAVNDPTGPQFSVHRAVRGGSYGYGADWCRSAYQSGGHPVIDWLVDRGFRLARPAPCAPTPTLGP